MTIVQIYFLIYIACQTQIFPARSLKYFILHFGHESVMLTHQQSNQIISVVLPIVVGYILNKELRP